MPPAATLQIFAIDAKDPAVAVWEKGFNLDIVETIRRAGLDWTQCGLYRYGKDPKTIDNSPPTVIVFAPGPIDQSHWTPVTKQIKDLMTKSKMAATFMLLEGTIVDANTEAWQDPNPYNDPRQLGESCGIHDGLVSSRAQTGTMGGCLLLKKAGEPDKIVGLTNNHVVNKQPQGEAWDKVTRHPIVIPSDGDHNQSQKKLGLDWEAAARGMDFFVDVNPEQLHPYGALHVLASRLKATQLPSDTPANIRQEWEKYQEAWVEGKSNLKAVEDVVKRLLALNIPDSNPIKKDLVLMGQWFRFSTSHFKAYELYSKVDESDKRYVGRTFAASGLRASTGTTRPNVALDWAVVEQGLQQTKSLYNNTSGHLTAYAKHIWDLDQARPQQDRVLTSCALGTAHPPMRISEMAEPVLGDYVFKIGKRTGATVGQINGARSVVNGNSNTAGAHKMGIGFPNKDTMVLHEVEIMATSRLPDQLNAKGYLRRFSDNGDSGSWILDSDGKLVGLLWGYGSSTALAQFTPIRDVVDSIKEVTGGWETTLLPEFPFPAQAVL